MDPASALGLAAACLGIVTKLGVTINTLHNLRGKYKNSDRTISFFIIHLTTLRSASNRLSDWIERSSLTTLSVGEKVDLQQSVDACNALVEMIDLYVSRVGKGSGPFSFGSRVRFLWDEAEIREAREILQLQVQALMFQFQIIQLWVRIVSYDYFKLIMITGQLIKKELQLEHQRKQVLLITHETRQHPWWRMESVPL